jgi:hypothetical protein
MPFEMLETRRTNYFRHSDFGRSCAPQRPADMRANRRVEIFGRDHTSTCGQLAKRGVPTQSTRERVKGTAHTVPFRDTLDRQDRNDPVRSRVNENDLVVVDEILIASPLWIDLDQHGGNGRDPYRGGNRRSDVDRNVQVRSAGRAARVDHGLANLGLLLGVERDVGSARAPGRSFS